MGGWDLPLSCGVCALSEMSGSVCQAALVKLSEVILKEEGCEEGLQDLAGHIHLSGVYYRIEEQPDKIVFKQRLLYCSIICLTVGHSSCNIVKMCGSV